VKGLYSVNTSFSGSLLSQVSSQVGPVLVFLSYVYEDLFFSLYHSTYSLNLLLLPHQKQKSQQRMVLRTSQRIARVVLGFGFNSIFAKSFLPRMAETRTFAFGSLTQCYQKCCIRSNFYRTSFCSVVFNISQLCNLNTNLIRLFTSFKSPNVLFSF